MKVPQALKQGDKIAIVASARKISSKELKKAIQIIEHKGYECVLGKSIDNSFNQFSATDEERAIDLQNMLDDSDIKAILFARGGYGSVRVVDKIDFSAFEKKPKWLVGYSDITVFHSHINRNCGVRTLHASMPINFADNSKEALDSLFYCIEGKQISYTLDSHKLNRIGLAIAEIIGGNLSVLYSLLGSVSFPDLKGKILFIEDLDEYLYHIDRMMIGFKRAGVFNDIAGIVVGGMTDMNDNAVPFGKTAEEIISDVCSDFNFPMVFGFPAGHFKDNKALILGKSYKLDVGEKVVIS